MRTARFRVISIMLLLSVFINSCKKDEPDTESQTAVDNTICQTEFTAVSPIVNGIAIDQKGVKRTFGPAGIYGGTCAQIIIDPKDTLDGFPVTMIIDFGTGCTDSVDGKTRKGKIIAVFNRKWSSAGTQVDITFDNYFVNDVKYMGNLTFIKNANSYSTIVSNGKCTNGVWNLEWSCSREVTWISGQGDLDPKNDVFQVTGTESGKNREGKLYTVKIIKPLVKRSNCKWIQEGSFELTPDGLQTRTVDFGNGSCDSKATLTIGDNVYSFTLK